MPTIKLNESKTEKVLLPKGSYQAYLVQVIDLWTQEEKLLRQVRLTFQIAYNSNKYFLSKNNVGLSLFEKAPFSIILRAIWYSPTVSNNTAKIEFDKIVWKPCLVQVDQFDTKDQKTKAPKTINTIDTVVSMPNGSDPKPFEGETLVFDLDNYDEETFQKLPKWVQETIEKSPEYGEAIAVKDLPF